MPVSVVIPFYKNRVQLDKCLEHLRQQTCSVQVYIHDNSDENIYFTRAINIGLRYFLEQTPSEPYIIILNQDMYLEPQAVEEMVSFMDATPDCGIGMPLQLSHEKPNEVIFAGGFAAYPIGTAGCGPLDDFQENRQIRWASACCWIMRTRMLREIGLLDENMQLIGSDSDYCFMARSRGFQIWNIVKARGIHEGGASKVFGSPILHTRKVLDTDYYARKWITGELFEVLNHPDVPATREALAPDIDNIRGQVAELHKAKQNERMVTV
ncbi:MAG TPA: glycosyltransferase [Sedimentisphaerales bacterium]|nr:glycosyltransferase [Sedimentisphaerales bacterium]